MDAKRNASEMIRSACARLLPKDGIRRLCSEDIFVARRDKSGIAEHRFDRPLASLLVQGAKTTLIGCQEFEISENQILTVAVDMPSSSVVRDATADRPLLTVFFHINPQTVSELLPEMNCSLGHCRCAPNGVAVNDADDDFLETIARVLALAGKPVRDEFLIRMLLRELHYLLIRNTGGSLLRAIYGSGLPGRQLFQAIEYLKERLDRLVTINELAGAACMSESSLYRHFKSVTGLSPLQYHKQLRLHEARRIMLAENEQAANAAFRVGFESIPQFNREYKRLFGQPPRRDTKRKK